MNTKKDIIILFSNKHTGTHFIFGALSLHDQVSLPIGRGFEYGDTIMGTIQRQFINGELTLDEFSDITYDYTISDARERAYYEEMSSIGFPTTRKTQYTYLLHQVHYECNIQTDWTKHLKAIVAVRDPLLAVISAMKRGWHDPDIMLYGFKYISTLKDVFFFPVDLWQNKREKAFDMYAYLGLTPTIQCSLYISQWPIYGSIDQEEWRTEKYLGTEYYNELCECIDMFENREIHHLLEQPIRVLRGLGLKEFYTELGYKDLLWY